MLDVGAEAGEDTEKDLEQKNGADRLIDTKKKNALGKITRPFMQLRSHFGKRNLY